jgi:hypothetical protein
VHDEVVTNLRWGIYLLLCEQTKRPALDPSIMRTTVERKGAKEDGGSCEIRNGAICQKLNFICV